MSATLIAKRLFSWTRQARSHIGSAPVYLSPGTKVDVTPLKAPKIIRKGRRALTLSKELAVEGPRGKIKMDIPDFVDITPDTEGIKLTVSVNNPEDKIQRSLWGTVRSHLDNHVVGVNEGHLAILKFVGTGYRAQLENDGKFVACKVGASIPQGLAVPDGIQVKSPSPTSLIIEGCNKQQVRLFAANLRKFHPPEPYKGKGIYVDGETIKLKDKKIK